MPKAQNAVIEGQTPAEDAIGEALAAAQQTLRLAAQDIAARGIMLESEDWRGDPIQKVNPSVKLQKEATQVILSLRNLLLQEAKAARKKGS